MAELHIIFLRHGFSIANLTKQTSFIGVLRDHGGSLRFSQSVKNTCCKDASLTQVGQRQVRAAGGRLSKVFDPLIRLYKEEVFSSGLTRTVQTAMAFIDGYNEYQEQFTKRITPLPYISEQRIRWCCCADLDNQVQSIDTIREAVQRDDITIEPIRPLEDPTSLHWRKPNVRMFQTQVIPVLGERIGHANAVIVVSHKNNRQDYGQDAPKRRDGGPDVQPVQWRKDGRPKNDSRAAVPRDDAWGGGSIAKSAGEATTGHLLLLLKILPYKNTQSTNNYGCHQIVHQAHGGKDGHSPGRIEKRFQRHGVDRRRRQKRKATEKTRVAAKRTGHYSKIASPPIVVRRRRRRRLARDIGRRGIPRRIPRGSIPRQIPRGSIPRRIPRGSIPRCISLVQSRHGKRRIPRPISLGKSGTRRLGRRRSRNRGGRGFEQRRRSGNCSGQRRRPGNRGGRRG